MKKVLFLAIVGLSFAAATARGEQSGGLEWSAWQRLPVLDEGRIMPLDTFARTQVTKICGTANPRLGNLGMVSQEELDKLTPAEVRRLIAANQPRRFIAAELVFAWILEPEVWENKPILRADDEILRSNVLQVPLFGEDGGRLKYVSPRQVETSTKFAEQWVAVIGKLRQAQQRNRKPELTALDQKVKELNDALTTFERLTYDPSRVGDSHGWIGDGRSWSREEVLGLDEDWNGLQKAILRQNFTRDKKSELAAAAAAAGLAMRKLTAAWAQTETARPEPVKNSEPLAAAARQTSETLAACLADRAQRNAEGSGPPEVNLAFQAARVAKRAAQIHWSLYDAGETAHVAPALEPTALEADRFRSEIHPWISLQALLQGSRNLLGGYPPQQVERIRDSWAEAQAAYRDRNLADRGAKFFQALEQFAAEVRGLSASIEPARRRLLIQERDDGLLAKTAYPAAVVTNVEFYYNRINPFFWSGCVSLAAVGALALSFLVPARKPLFWGGIAVLVLAVALVAGGFLTRMYLTHWAPVTSMYETIVWVAMCVALLTIWLTFLPLLSSLGRTAWNLTALPGTQRTHHAPRDGTHSAESDEHKSSSEFLPGWWPAARVAALVLRLGIFLLALYILGVFQPASWNSEYRLASFLPRADIGSNLPTASSLLVWLSSIFVTGILTWYVPRLIPAAIVAIPLTIAMARRADAADRVEKVYRWRGVALAGAAAATLAAWAAYSAPFPKEIQALMPVLRSNFWLGIHVLTIVTSYAGALVAWVIANATLGCYLFGQYRVAPARGASAGRIEETAPTIQKELPESNAGGTPPLSEERRPPLACGILAALNYRVIQITVLLLTAGTILGGLWADVSWGRFWGWDSKEVGALIALLVLMIALHGRKSGWHGDLSLSIGGVLGFVAVMWAWYGVNFLLGTGKHAYGGNEAGQWAWFLSACAVQIGFIFLALFRIKLETGKPASAELPAAETATY